MEPKISESEARWEEITELRLPGCHRDSHRHLFSVGAAKLRGRSDGIYGSHPTQLRGKLAAGLLFQTLAPVLNAHSGYALRMGFGVLGLPEAPPQPMRPLNSRRALEMVPGPLLGPAESGMAAFPHLTGIIRAAVQYRGSLCKEASPEITFWHQSQIAQPAQDSYWGAKECTCLASRVQSSCDRTRAIGIERGGCLPTTPVQHGVECSNTLCSSSLSRPLI